MLCDKFRNVYFRFDSRTFNLAQVVLFEQFIPITFVRNVCLSVVTSLQLFIYIFSVYLFWRRRKGWSFEHGSYSIFLHFPHWVFSRFFPDRWISLRDTYSILQLMIVIEWRL